LKDNRRKGGEEAEKERGRGGQKDGEEDNCKNNKRGG
jgi:hypothetical protein